MNMSPIQISIKDYKAVKSAEIGLNGITLISGINGSGKSSISRLLYYAFKYANDYESIASDSVMPELRQIGRLVSNLTMGLRRGVSSVEMRNYYRHAEDANSIEVKIDAYSAALELFKEFVVENENTLDSNDENVLKRIRSIIDDSILEKRKNKDASLSEMIEDVIKKTQGIKEKVLGLSSVRGYALYRQYLTEVLESDLKGVRIAEYGVPFVGKEVSNVPVLSFIQQAVYIDTPMIVGMNRRVWYPIMEYWKDLNDLLEIPVQKSYSHAINQYIKNVIHGGSYYDDSLSFKGNMKYKRDDGLVIDLLDSATGIKSFSLLQTLLRNGVLSENTLLVIDEPEAHLHPQWIVEYARIIIMLHKKLGTKFFIASHSTDFVSAMKYIAEKERVSKSVSFYLAEEDLNKPFSYNYKSIGTDIEPIFASFNKSLDKIGEYGGWQ